MIQLPTASARGMTGVQVVYTLKYHPDDETHTFLTVKSQIEQTNDKGETETKEDDIWSNIVLSPVDSNLLVSSSIDGTVRLWHIDRSAPPRVLYRERNVGLDFSPEGDEIVIGCPDGVARIVDLKTPASGEADKNLYSNLQYLTSHDQVKFVICDREDYEWSVEKLNQYKLNEQCEVLFSGSHGEIQNSQLADWILEDQLPVRLQIQLHKFLWGDVPGK